MPSQERLNKEFEIIKLPKLNNVAILRGIAMVAVVLYHCYSPWIFNGKMQWFDCPFSKSYRFFFQMMLIGRMPVFISVSGYLFAHLIIDRGKYKSFADYWSINSNDY